MWGEQRSTRPREKHAGKEKEIINMVRKLPKLNMGTKKKV